MMEYKNVIDLFRKRFPNLTVTRLIDYDKDHYVVEAVEDLNKPGYNSPFYGLDKHTGKVTSFIPSLELDSFFEAVDNRTLWSGY